MASTTRVSPISEPKGVLEEEEKHIITYRFLSPTMATCTESLAMRISDIGLRNLSLHHRGSTPPAGIGGYVSLTKDAAADFFPFVAFAASWFECEAENLELAVFYNGAKNRVDIVVERKNHPNDGDKVSLEFCFEPGFPIQEFDEATFRVTKAEIDCQEKKRAARSSK